EDADITLRLYEELNPKLEGEDSLNKLNDEIEIPLIEVLSDPLCTKWSFRADLLQPRLSNAQFVTCNRQPDQKLRQQWLY
ncbi:MAG: hypothetical protein ACJ0Q2_00480, partial [Candidatus Azotimanducaceae bacterium]